MEQTKPTKLFLLRHSESAPSRDLPESDWPLSSKGCEDAHALVETLQPLQIQRIFSSPYLRALQTVQPIAEVTALKIEVMADLRERKLTSGFEDNWPQLVRKAWQDLSFSLPGGESGYQCQRRIVRCLRQIVLEHSGENTLVSSHGNAIALFLNSLDASFGYGDWAAMMMPSLYRIVVDGPNWHWDSIAI